MIDITPLKPYILEDIACDIAISSKIINEIGFNNWFENQLSKFLDCSKLSSTGHRLIQTNFKHYNYEITTIIAMIERYAEDKDYYYERLLKQHNSNLEFEAINGFEYISLNDNAKKVTKKRSKQTSIKFSNEDKKESVAERKLKAHIAKINSLNIKLNAAKHDNTL